VTSFCASAISFCEVVPLIWNLTGFNLVPETPRAAATSCCFLAAAEACPDGLEDEKYSVECETREENMKNYSFI